MKCDMNTVLTVAESQVGYLEKKTNANLDDFTANAGSANYTKYNREYLKWNAGGAQPMQWCAAFVSWCFVESYGLDAAKKLLCGNVHCYTPTGAGYFKNKGQYIARGKGTPKAGDVVFFYSTSKGRVGHVGIVYKVSSTTVYTIEGNTSGANTLITNGGGVCKKSYKLTSTYIDGYGRPDYVSVESTVTNEIKSLELGDRLLKKGMIGEDVKDLQNRLIKANYSVGKYGADGEFGSATENAVKAFQSDNKLDVDGIVGEKTVTVLKAKTDEPEGKEDEEPVKKPEPVVEGDINIASGSWNVRTGPGAEYSSAGVARGGDKLKEVKNNGWVPVEYNGQVCWISPKAVK